MHFHIEQWLALSDLEHEDLPDDDAPVEITPISWRPDDPDAWLVTVDCHS